MRFRPKNMDELRIPADMPVEIERGIPLSARIAVELRSLPGWPHGLFLIVHIDPDPRFSLVKVERV